MALGLTSGRDLGELLAADFDASLEVLDAAALRQFLRELDARADHRVAVIEFAARHAGGAPYLEPDPKLLEDAARVARGGKRKGDHHRPEVRRVLERARRALLRGDAADARKVYEIVLGLAADLALAPRGEEHGAPEEPAPFPHAGSYLASVYESVPAGERVEAMLDAVERLSAVDVVASPIELMIAAAPR
ncbi:MAG: hypothetical protein JNK04_06985, partial [Myxococcales bacterium]|nr:hypothetical protein [Myxococcales bacterium]